MHIRLLAAVSMLAVALVLAGAGRGATPASGTVGPARCRRPGRASPTPPPAVADPARLPAARRSTARTPSATTSRSPSASTRATGRSHGGGASVTINWADSANDFDLYVYDAAGNQVAIVRAELDRRRSRRSSGTRPAPTTSSSSRSPSRARATAEARASSRRRRRTISSGGPVAYNGVRVAGANPSTAPTTTAARVTRDRSSCSSRRTSAARPRSRRSASTRPAPPSTPRRLRRRRAARLAHTLVLRSRDAGLTWQATTPEYAGVDAHPATLDPYVYLDTDTSRLFDIDTLLAGSTDLSFSDDQGELVAARR